MTEAEWLAATDPEPMARYLMGDPVAGTRHYADDVVEVNEYPNRRVGDRKLRLLACAYCRAVESSFPACPASRAAVEVTERYVVGAASEDELRAASKSASDEHYAPFLAPLPTVDHVPSRLSRLARRLLGWPIVPPPVANYSPEVMRRVSYTRVGVMVSRPWIDGTANWAVEHLISTDLRRHAHDGPGLLALQTSVAAAIRDLFGNPYRPVAVEPSWLTSTVVALANGIYEERAFDRMPILADALQDAGCDNDDVLTHCRGDSPHVRGCWVVDLLTGRA